MIRQLRGLLAVWALLMLLLGNQIVFTLLPTAPVGGPVILASAALAIALVGLIFMHLRTAPSLAQAFALGALLWLSVLLGLGVMDTLTRHDFSFPMPLQEP